MLEAGDNPGRQVYMEGLENETNSEKHYSLCEQTTINA